MRKILLSITIILSLITPVWAEPTVVKNRQIATNEAVTTAQMNTAIAR